MSEATSLISTFPYEAPRQHWQQARDGSLKELSSGLSRHYQRYPAAARTLKD